MAEKLITITENRARRAYWFGIANGLLIGTGDALIDPVTVLPAFVSRLTNSEIAIGSISALGMSGWSLPQLLAANYLRSKIYKRPLYLLGAILRSVGLFAIIPLVFFSLPDHPSGALLGFFLGYSIFALTGGMSGPAFLDIVAKTVPARRLGAFFGHRQFWGGLGAIGSGALVRWVLAQHGITFPNNYLLLFSGGLLLFIPAWLLFSLIYEPAGKAAEQTPLLHFLRGSPAMVQEHPEFRLLLVSRLLTGSVSIALPFYIIFARRILGVPEAMIGTYISVQMAGSVLFVPIWAYLNDRKGPRGLLTAVSSLYLGVSLIAMAAAFNSDINFGRAALLAVFFPLAAIGSGTFIGSTNYIFAIAPEEQRTTYIGIYNTLFALTSFLPLFGGWVVAATSFSFLFCLAAVFAVAGLVATIRLPAEISPANSG